MIKKIVSYVNEDGFEFNFEPIEDTLSIKKTKDGFEARYLIQDEMCESPDEDKDDGVFLVNYHSDFQVERDDIIIEDDVKAWYQATRKVSQLKEYHVFALACLVHSGVWLSLESNFHCDPGGWDTSHVGMVLVSKKETKKVEKASELAQGLVEHWNKYLTGDVYCGVKETYSRKKEPIDYDVFGGCFGYENAKESLKEI